MEITTAAAAARAAEYAILLQQSLLVTVATVKTNFAGSESNYNVFKKDVLARSHRKHCTQQSSPGRGL